MMTTQPLLAEQMQPDINALRELALLCDNFGNIANGEVLRCIADRHLAMARLIDGYRAKLQELGLSK
ncbi:MAG: hypothetical protein ACRDAM_14965, partial [Casimicrobium sp.]